MIIGPACATAILGARKMYPGAVLLAGTRILTIGGLRSGRERKRCAGGAGCLAAAA